MNISPEGPNPSESVGRQRVPKCSKCRNHKIVAPKKGHKGLCQFENCCCPKCRTTNERRAVMKLHIRQRRQLEKEEKKQKLGQMSSAGSSSQMDNNPTTVSSNLPPMQWPIVYSFGSQSNMSEASTQSWGSMVTISDMGSTEPDDNYLQWEQFNQNN